MKARFDVYLHGNGVPNLDCSVRTECVVSPYDVLIIGQVTIFLDFDQTEQLAAALNKHIAARTPAPVAEEATV